MASPNISEIITTTINSRTGELADNVSKSRALLDKISKNKGNKPVSGGNTIYQEMQYAENGTFLRYSGYDQLNISPSDVFSAAEYNIKQAAVAVSISGLEMLQNAGKEKIIDLLESRIQNAEVTLKNNIALDCYSDGTANSSKQIGGLQYLVADAPSSGTVGGINRATYSFWRNISFDATTDGGTAAVSTNIQDYMWRVWVQIVRGSEQPDLIVADNNYWRLYMESLTANQRFVDEATAAAGFQNITFQGCPVVLDGGYGGGAPTNHMYFLNSKYLFFRPMSGRNFVALEPDRFAVNQDAMVKLIAWAGNMTMSCGFLQGVLKD